MSKVVVFLCVLYCASVIGKRDIYTEDKVEYKFFPYSNTSIHFRVKAANDVHVGLTTGPHEADPMIEVVIGGWANTNSVIRRRFRTIPEKVSVETPGIVSAGKYCGFWVSWDRGVIAVGHEGADTPFMSWTDPHPFDVTFVGVHTGFGSTGSWKIGDPPSDSGTPPPDSASNDVDSELKIIPNDIYTEDTVKYKFFPYSNGAVQSVHFQVKAGNDVHVGLTTGPQESDPMYEIVIGGWSNTNSVIRRRFRTIPEKVSAETPGIVSGGEFRGFWIRWDGGVIAVGREGETAPFMSWKDPKPFRVTYVGVHTGFGSTGFWRFEDPPAPVTEPPPSSTTAATATSQCCNAEPPLKPEVLHKGEYEPDVNTFGDADYIFFPVTNRSVHFKVKASLDAHIALTPEAEKKEPIIEVFIGGWNNTMSAIRRNGTKPDKAKASSPGILSDNELRGFWIRWNDGDISVGREGTDAPFISWVDPNPLPIGFVGVRTGGGAQGSWIVEVPSSGPGTAPL